MSVENLIPTFDKVNCIECMLEDFCNENDADGCRAFIESTISNIENSRRSDDDPERVSSYDASIAELKDQATKQGLEVL